MESYEIIWQNALKQIENIVNTLSYETFITQIQPIDIVNNQLVLRVPSRLLAETINQGNIKDAISQAISLIDTPITDYVVVVANSREEYLKSIKEDNISNFQHDSLNINSKFTFDSYVVGPSNQFLFNAAKAVATAPGEFYNPLFIYGGSGLGKTHILMAIANYLKLNNPTKNVLYSTCEQFTNQMVESLAKGKLSPQEFRKKYRSVDVLLIDDVQFLAHKESTQMEFFYTFDELISQNKQVVLTCDRPPKEIELLTDRLRTRFEGGLLADVQPPELETRIAILKKKAEEKKAIIDIKILSYLAEVGGKDIRSLIGQLTNIIFASSLHDKPFSIELVNETLKECSTIEKEELKIEDIINCVCNFYKITKDDLLGKKKNHEFVEPRQVCIYLVTDLLNIPLVAIGHKMGGRDHATIIYARDKVSELMKTDSKLATEINDLKNMLLKK